MANKSYAKQAKLLLVVILLFVCSAGLPASGSGEFAALPSLLGSDVATKAEATQSLDEVGILLNEKRYDEAARILARTVFNDQDQLERAEQYFSVIRTVRDEYLAKGEEVRDLVPEIVSGDLTTEEVLPRAVEALALIDAMEEIIPYPNERDLEIRTNLRYTVQLNVDIRIFAENMDAARERLAAGDYAGAADIYVNGESDLIERLLSSLDQGEELQVSLENGVDIQRPAFEIRDYDELFKTVVSTSREAIRRVGNEFVATSPAALEEAAQLTTAFETGDFTDVESEIDDYLDVLTTVTQFTADVAEFGAVIEQANALMETRRAEDAGFRLDWHVAFLKDIVYGRDGFEDEGLLYTVNTIRSIMEDGPVQAARNYSDQRFADAIEIVNSIVYPEQARGFTGMNALESTITDADIALSQSEQSFRNYLQMLSISRSLGLPIVAPPEAGGELDAQSIREAWARYPGEVLSLLNSTVEIGDEALRGEIQDRVVKGAVASMLREMIARSVDGVDSARTQHTTVTSLNTQRAELQFILGTLTDPAAGTYRELLSRAIDFQARAAETVALREDTAAAIDYITGFMHSRVDDLESYELSIVEEVARIEFNRLQSRLALAEPRVEDGEEQLDGILETVTPVDAQGRTVTDENGLPVTFQSLRKYPDRARDILSPLVGTTSGSRIVSTRGSELQVLLDDSQSFVAKYESELPYIASADSIQNEVSRGLQLVAEVGPSDGNALFGRARSLLQTALNEMAAAEDLEQQGDSRIAEIRSLVTEAQAANEAEDLDLAGTTLAQAERLLKSDDTRIEDASDLFSESLATWYRPDLEDRWNNTQRELNRQIVQAQTDIVITRVRQAVRDAQPLIDNLAWSDALGILKDADELWNSVFPTSTWPPLVRDLRFVETALAKQNERVLREDDPDYDKLAPLLSRATQALTEGLLDEAQLLLDQFLNAQPNNLQARLLEVDIELESEEGTVDTKIDNLITGTLPSDTDRSEIDELDATQALELQTLLIAILDRLGERTDVSQSIISRIENEVETLELIMSPPRIIEPEPDRVAESNALMNQALARGPLPSLSRTDLQSAIDLLEQALDVDPTNRDAAELLSLALRLPDAPTRIVLDAAEQKILSDARTLFSRRDFIGALTLVEQLWKNTDNRLDTELNRFREDLLDVIRRGS